MTKQIWAFNRVAGRTLCVICKEDYDEERPGDREGTIRAIEGRLEGYNFEEVVVIDGVSLPVEKKFSIKINEGSVYNA